MAMRVLYIMLVYNEKYFSERQFSYNIIVRVIT